MKKIMKLEFWQDVAERAAATFLQTVVGLILVDTAAPIWALDWWHIIAAGASAAVLSVAKSVSAGLKNGTPSVGDVEVGKSKLDLHDAVEDGQREPAKGQKAEG